MQACQQATARDLAAQTASALTKENVVQLQFQGSAMPSFEMLCPYGNLARLECIAMRPALTAFPVYIIKFPLLRVLNLSDNKLTTLPREFRMPNLKRIGLANNLFRALEGLQPLAQCPSLEYVDLEDNAVQSVAGYREAVFAMCHRLRVLDNKTVDNREDDGESEDEEESEEDEEDDEEDEAVDDNEAIEGRESQERKEGRTIEQKEKAPASEPPRKMARTEKK